MLEHFLLEKLLRLGLPAVDFGLLGLAIAFVDRVVELIALLFRVFAHFLLHLTDVLNDAAVGVTVLRSQSRQWRLRSRGTSSHPAADAKFSFFTK